MVGGFGVVAEGHFVLGPAWLRRCELEIVPGGYSVGHLHVGGQERSERDFREYFYFVGVR